MAATFTLTAGHQWMYSVWVVVMFFCIGGNYSVFPTATARLFGRTWMGPNYGMLFLTTGVMVLVDGPSAQPLLGSFGFLGLQLFTASGTLIAAVLLFLMKRRVTSVVVCKRLSVEDALQSELEDADGDRPGSVQEGRSW
eukprot:PLAT13686.1.p1 GENE.PLAT13686.1~~PLAT13686.1.p1  ORF type:complete len:153 (+),score=66.79 PLAT13686.1:43-459(+)